jgi:hypothetical protein
VAAARDVQYYVLPDPDDPYLLARVRWPDVCQAISPVRTHWQDDPGLFDAPYDPGTTRVTRERAAAIAAEWKAHLPSDDTGGAFEFPLMRRMPADWSNLSRGEKRAWSIDLLKTPVRRERARTGSRFVMLRFRRRVPTERRTFEPFELPPIPAISDVAAHAGIAPHDVDVTVVLDEAPAYTARGWFDGRVVAMDHDVLDLTQFEDVATNVEDA